MVFSSDATGQSVIQRTVDPARIAENASGCEHL
jgi:hypothetical protein